MRAWSNRSSPRSYSATASWRCLTAAEGSAVSPWHRASHARDEGAGELAIKPACSAVARWALSRSPHWTAASTRSGPACPRRDPSARSPTGRRRRRARAAGGSRVRRRRRPRGGRCRRLWCRLGRRPSRGGPHRTLRGCRTVTSCRSRSIRRVSRRRRSGTGGLLAVVKLPTVMTFRVCSGLCDGKDVACRPGGRCEVPDPRRRGIQTEDSVAQRLPICSIQPEARCDPGCGVPSLWQGGPAFFPPLTRGLTCSRASETFPIWSEAPPVPPRPAGASHMRVICLRAIAVKSGGKEFIYVGGLSRRGRS